MSGDMQPGAADRPNIIFLHTDQQTWDALSARGNPHLRTPNIDRLERSGVSFTRSYCTDPVCAPARTSWMTGLHSSQTGVPFNGGSVHDDLIDLGRLLRRGGYSALHAGKWHVDGRDPSGSFTVLYSGRCPMGAGGGEYYDLMTRHAAADFLSTYSGTEPFFLQVGFVNPHDICEFEHWQEVREFPEVERLGLGEPDSLPPLPKSFAFDPDETIVQRAFRRGNDPIIHGPIQRAVQLWDESKWRYLLWVYYRYVEKVDGEVGRVLDALAESKHRENTIIVFSSDHGEAAGRHRMFQKFTAYEESIRTPLIVTTLGDRLAVRRGASDGHLISGVDILPTVCDYAGIEIPPDLPGRSIRQLVESEISGERDEWRQSLLVEYNYWGRVLITGRHKLVTEYIPYGDDRDLTPPGPDESRLGRSQLFDLESDSEEEQNRVGTDGFPEISSRLIAELLQAESRLARRPLSNRKSTTTIRDWGGRVIEEWQRFGMR